MMERVKRMFSFGKSYREESEPESYVPTQEQLIIAREQEAVRDQIRLQSLRIQAELMGARQQGVHERNSHS